MDQHTGEPEPEQRQPRRWVLLSLAIVATLIVVCVLAIFLTTRPPVYRVTPGLEQTAARAQDNPAAAPLDLDQLGYSSGWYPPDGSQYAVEGDLVIFPQRPRNWNPVQDVYANVIPDKEIPALVFAPSGRDLSNLTRDIDRGWYYVGEWDLYDCQPITGERDWWQCMLTIGGNI